MSYLDHIRACNTHDMARYRPFNVAGKRVGWVRQDFATHLAAFPRVFRVEDGDVALVETLTDPASRTAAVREVLAALHVEGVVKARREEEYPVATAFSEPALFHIDRGAVSYFGVRAYGIHVNGFVRDGSGLKLWIGRRARDKAVAPGKLDNLVAGGQPAGLTLAENLRKEAAEEAAIPPDLADRAVPVGAISYLMENHHGLKPDVMFCFDLELPADFVPRNTDGEIDEFMLLPIDEVAARVRDTDDFKFNVNLVIIDFLIRHGLLRPDDEPDYVAIVHGLRRGSL